MRFSRIEIFSVHLQDVLQLSKYQQDSEYKIVPMYNEYGNKELPLLFDNMFKISRSQVG